MEKSHAVFRFHTMVHTYHQTSKWSLMYALLFKLIQYPYAVIHTDSSFHFHYLFYCLVHWSAKPMSLFNHKSQATCFLWAHFTETLGTTHTHPPHPYPPHPSYHPTIPTPESIPISTLSQWMVMYKWTLTIVNVSVLQMS